MERFLGSRIKACAFQGLNRNEFYRTFPKRVCPRRSKRHCFPQPTEETDVRKLCESKIHFALNCLLSVHVMVIRDI